MICSQCGKFYLEVVPTRCSCGGVLQSVSAQRPSVTADLAPMGAAPAAEVGNTTQVIYEEVTPPGVAWLTPSLLGDAVTHPTSPYDAAEIGAPPPPPAGLVQWHKTPDPKRLAQMTFMLLSVGLLAMMANSARLASFVQQPHTVARAQPSPSLTTKTPPAAHTSTSVNAGQTAHPTAAPSPSTTVQYTVQLSVPPPSAAPQKHSAPPAAKHQKHHTKHKLASMPLRGAHNPGQGHKSPGRQGHHPHK